MDAELKQILDSIKSAGTTTLTNQVSDLAKYFAQRKSYAVLAAAMEGMSNEELLAAGVALGQAWQAGNAASAAEAETWSNLGMRLLMYGLTKGLGSLAL